jgi:hypothetical protein
MGIAIWCHRTGVGVVDVASYGEGVVVREKGGSKGVTDITYPPYTPRGIRRLWGFGGLELFGIVVYMLEISDYVR